jgi:hypothetical protein
VLEIQTLIADTEVALEVTADTWGRLYRHFWDALDAVPACPDGPPGGACTSCLAHAATRALGGPA